MRSGAGGAGVALMDTGPQEAFCFHRDKGLWGCILGRNPSHFRVLFTTRLERSDPHPEELIDRFGWDRMCAPRMRGVPMAPSVNFELRSFKSSIGRISRRPFVPHGDFLAIKLKKFVNRLFPGILVYF